MILFDGVIITNCGDIGLFLDVAGPYTVIDNINGTDTLILSNITYSNCAGEKNF